LNCGCNHIGKICLNATSIVVAETAKALMLWLKSRSQIVLLNLICDKGKVGKLGASANLICLILFV